MRRRWTLRFLAGLALSALLVSGCSSKQEANDTLPSAEETTSSPALAPLGPPDLPMPDEARRQTPEGFNAFARYYVALINRLQNDLNPTFLRDFSRDCDTCDRLADDAQSDESMGYRYEGGAITITAIAPASLEGTEAETAFTVDQAAYSVVDADGTPVEGLSGEAVSSLPGGMSGVWEDGYWLATSLSFG
ncbi:DUF6318 family protein [Geodermatophilus sp. SYSU D00691]